MDVSLLDVSQTALHGRWQGVAGLEPGALARHRDRRALVRKMWLKCRLRPLPSGRVAGGPAAGAVPVPEKEKLSGELHTEALPRYLLKTLKCDSNSFGSFIDDA